MIATASPIEWLCGVTTATLWGANIRSTAREIMKSQAEREFWHPQAKRAGWGTMFRPILKGVGPAKSPTGRRVIRQAVKFARSNEGKKVVAQVKKVAASPEARKLASQAAQAARHVSEAATKPENQHRVKAAAKFLRQHAGR